MTKYGLRFEHVGLACREPGAACLFHRNQGYDVSPPVFDPEQRVNLVLCTKAGEPAVEVIYPEGVDEGPLKPLLRDREALVYHLCYSTTDVEASLRALREDGFRVACVSPAKHAILFGKKVSFYSIKGLGLVELIHE